MFYIWPFLKPRFNCGWTTRIWLCSRQGFFYPNHLSNRATCWNSHPILGKKNVHKIHQQRCQALLLGWKEIIFWVVKGDERGIIGYPASNPLILQLNWSEMSTWFPPFYTLSGIQEYQITQNPRIPIPESHITQNPRKLGIIKLFKFVPIGLNLSPPTKLSKSSIGHCARGQASEFHCCGFSQREIDGFYIRASLPWLRHLEKIQKIHIIWVFHSESCSGQVSLKLKS